MKGCVLADLGPSELATPRLRKDAHFVVSRTPRHKKLLEELPQDFDAALGTGMNIDQDRLIG